MRHGFLKFSVLVFIMLKTQFYEDEIDQMEELLREAIDPEKIHIGFRPMEPRIEGVTDETLRLLCKDGYSIVNDPAKRAGLVVCVACDVFYWARRRGDERVYPGNLTNDVIDAENPTSSGIFLKRKAYGDTNTVRVHAPRTFGANEVDITLPYACDEENILKNYMDDIRSRLMI
jgi:hypothetical protein